MHLTIAQRRRALALTMLGEGRSRGYDGMRYIGFVAMNRLAVCRQRDPDCQIEDIVFAPWQFSCWNSYRHRPNDPNLALLRHIGRVDPHSADGIRFTQAKGLAIELLDHTAGVDPTHGATFYSTRKVHPRWLPSMRLVFITRAHLFYAPKGRTA